MSRRIAFVFARFSGPYGAERALLYLVRELARRDYQVTLYTLQFHASCRSLLPDRNVEVVEAPMPTSRNHSLGILLNWMEMPALALKVRGRYDLIHVVNADGAVAGMAIRKLRPGYRKVPLVYSCNEPPRFCYDLRRLTLQTMSHSLLKRPLFECVSLFIKSLDRYSVRSADYIVANSDWTRDQVKRIYGRDSEIVYPGIDIARFSRYSREEARKALGIDPAEKVYISVSKLHPRKRLDRALELYGSKTSKNGGTRLMIIGDGPDRANLATLAETMKLPNVQFLGTKGDDLPLYEAAADYFINTYKDEPFGVAPLEAKVAGCELVGQQSPYPIISLEESASRMTRVYDRILNA